MVREWEMLPIGHEFTSRLAPGDSDSRALVEGL